MPPPGGGKASAAKTGRPTTSRAAGESLRSAGKGSPLELETDSGGWSWVGIGDLSSQGATIAFLLPRMA